MNMHPSQSVVEERERDPAQELTRFIVEARTLQPYPNIIWSSFFWDITSSDSKARAHLDNKKTFVFAEHAPSKTPNHERILFSEAFSDLAKACLVRRRANRGMGAGPQMVFLRAARYLYAALPLPVRHDPTLINRGHFVLAENAIVRREKSSSAYRAAQHLDEFGRMLDRHRLCRTPVEFRSSVPRPKAHVERTSATFEERVQGLPTADVLNALAAISNEDDIEQRPFDLLRVRVAELLLIGGFRIGEALTMPVGNGRRNLNP